MAIKKMVKCACQLFEFGQFEPETDTDYTTRCVESTYKTFAMGHDAKLVGFLVRAELAGDEIRTTANGVSHHFQGAVHAASSISERLAVKAQLQLDAARARLAKKELRQAAKASKTPKPVAPVEVTAKVGRWEYRGFIGQATGDFAYVNKKGQTVAVPQGKYTLV